MNIGIFTDSYTPVISGVVTSTRILKKELEKLGHTVTIVTVKHPEAADNGDHTILRLPSIPFLPLKTQRVGSIYSTKIWRKIKKLDLDIIHTQTEFSIGLFGRIVAKRLGIPVVHTYHTMYEDYVHYVAPSAMLKPAAGVAKRVSKAYCKDCHGVIVPTSKVEDKLKEYGLKHNNIQVIPTGMELEPFQRENQSEDEILSLKRRIGLDDNDKVVLFIGRVAKEKSIDVVINAVNEIIKEHDNIKMLIVGDGPELANLRKIVSNLQLNHKIKFTGEIPWDDIGKYYALGDVFVSASTTETQGLTFTEAMAARIPVIAKYDKNLEDILKDSVNGLIFKKNEDLKAVLERVLLSEGVGQEIATRAYDEIYPLSSVFFGKRVSELYQNTIDSHKMEKTV